MPVFGRARGARAYRSPSGARWPVVEFALALVAVGALAYVVLDRGIVTVPLSDAGGREERADHHIHLHFIACAGAGGTCVVDGDTIRIEGVPIRIADIDTPETRDYACAEELALGRAATARLIALLNEGPFAVMPYERDEDVYGRKLRVLERDGRSLGMVLVAEGLARAWDGARRDWC